MLCVLHTDLQKMITVKQQQSESEMLFFALWNMIPGQQKPGMKTWASDLCAVQPLSPFELAKPRYYMSCTALEAINTSRICLSIIYPPKWPISIWIVNGWFPFHNLKFDIYLCIFCVSWLRVVVVVDDNDEGKVKYSKSVGMGLRKWKKKSVEFDFLRC